MHKAKFEVRTVTPLFIAGADQEDISNEALRPPSLRGVMRWWYRTLLLAKTNSLTINEYESDLFGSTNMKSPISIIQENFSGSDIAYSKQWSFDIDYLFFSFRKTRDRSERRFYDVDTTFNLTLFAKEEEKLKRAISIFWLALNLGSIGSRARRGAGSLSLIKAEFKSSEPLNMDMIINSNSYSDYQNYLSTNLKKICNASQISFDRFNKIAEIWVKNQEFNDWKKALIEGSRWLKQEKDRLKNSYGSDQRPYLGMPRKGFDIPNGNYKRRASPIWLAVAKSSSNKYFLRMVILKSKFLPEFGGRFSFKKREYNAKNYQEILSDIVKGLSSSGWAAIKW